MKKVKLLMLLLLMVAGAHAQKSDFKIAITPLTKKHYICTSYGLPDDKTPFPANSLFIVTDAGIILLDTPWDEAQTQQLIDSVQLRFNKKIVLCIATHSHDDRIGGMNILKQHGTKTYASAATYRLAKQKGNPLPEFTFKRDTSFNVGGIKLQTYFPGEGHTSDNIVIWLPQQKILFGGCFIKSLETNSIGYTADSNLKQWPVSVNKLSKKYSDAQIVIPGHQGWQGGNKMLAHTISIIKASN
jgi:metallo-beta-lactamase class B